MSDTPMMGHETPTWPSGTGPYDRPSDRMAQTQPATPYHPPAQSQPSAPYTPPGQPRSAGSYHPPAPTGRRPRNELSPRTRTMLGIAHFIALAVAIVEALLLLRIALMLLGANPDAAFTTWIYSWTAPLVAPFQDVFTNAATRGHVLDAAAILAVIVYALFGALVEGFARWLARL